MELSTVRFLEANTNMGLSSKRRYTKDGRICASAFVQDGKTYTDCTSAKSPDGQITGKEWCYVDPNAGGAPNWGYCRPVLDYDKVRMKARDLMLELIVEVRKVTDLVTAQITPASKTLSILNNLKNKQNEMDAKLAKIIKSINVLEENFNTLLTTKEKWEEIDQEISKLENELAQLKEMNDSGALNKNPNNCEGLLGYEAEGPGDGLLAKYFDNEDFLGKTVEQTDEEINFTWENECPAPSVNEENFSIKWSTWLRVPTTGKYTFYTESDDGNSLYVNGQYVISHFMGASSVNGNKKTNSWLDSNLGDIQEGKTDVQPQHKRDKDKITTASGPVYLNGGMKYKLDYLMYHSVHNENEPSGRSFSKLYWSSDQIPKNVIGKNFYYTSNKVAPLKISGLNPNLMALGVLKENENAFKDTEELKLQDIPFQYQNKGSIRVNFEFGEQSFKFTSTSPISVFVAVDANRPNPLPPDFEDQQEGLSVLKILKTAKVIDNRVKASESVLYKVYKKKFPSGKITFPLTQSKKAMTHRLIVFYSIDPVATSPVSCGGETLLISNPTGPAFDKCEVSSKYPDQGWNCEAGLSGKLVDNAGSMWASNGQGIGAWMTIKFKSAYQITKIQIKDRNVERNAKLEISFGTNSADPVTLDLKNIDEIQEFPIPPVISSEVKITVKSVYTAINNGGAFNIYGITCLNPEKTSSSSQAKVNDKKKALKLTCSDTFKNKDDFERMNLKEGDTTKILCEETCALSNVAIYGDGIYSEDSSICKAAFHAGVLTKGGDKIKLTIVRGESFYKSGQRNGIQSNAKQTQGVGIQFQQIKTKEASIDFKIGMKLDIYDLKLKKWLPGYIETSEPVSRKFTKLTIRKEGYGPEDNEVIQWPNPDKLKYCGEMLKERNCDKDSSSPNSLNSEQIKIFFSPGPKSKVEGYLLDDGKVFTKRGDIEYGWSRDISDLARKKNINTDPLMDEFILFPPDPKSHWCAENPPKVACESVDWSIKVANGKYNVKITVGDPAEAIQTDLKLNDKVIMKNKIQKKNIFFTTNDDLIILDGIIRVKSECDGSCENSWSRMSAIEINKLPGRYQVFYCFLSFFNLHGFFKFLLYFSIIILYISKNI